MAYKEVNPFYKGKRWLRKRAAILRRDEYMCREAKRFGRCEAAELVHHIYPLEEYPELAYVDWNLISVGNARHNTFHNRDDNTLTAAGEYWKTKRRREFEEFYPPLKNNF